MNLNPFSLVPNAMQGFEGGDISGLVPSLDWIVKVADPRLIPSSQWLGGMVTDTIIPISMAILLFALCCALIQEQHRAAIGASDFTRIFYRLLFYVAILVAYPFFFGWLVEATHLLGDLFLSDEQITQLTRSMFEQFRNWNLGAVSLGRAVLVGIIAYITYFAAFLLFMVFFIVRYMLLALLFIIGPIVISFSVWDVTSRFKNWLIALIQVGCWVVVLKFIIAVSLSFSFDQIYGTNQSNLFYVIAANFLYVIMLWHTPAIAAALIGGTSLGFIGTHIVGVTAQRTMETKNWMQNKLTGGNGPPSPLGAMPYAYDAQRDPYGALCNSRP